MTFKDHFSGHADRYAQYRPDYPPGLFTYLAALAPARTCAWDCGTGNGQAARALAAYFDRVVATDASTQQIEHAPPHPRVHFAVAPAEASPLPDASADLITVAQALHWFDAPRFMAEAQRVGKPEAVLAVWTYTMATVSPEVDAVVMDFYDEVLGAYWPPERKYVEDGYRALTLPGEPLQTPTFTMEKYWSLEELIGYLGTWSAVKNYRQLQAEDPLPALRRPLEVAWGNTALRQVRWPMLVHARRLG